MRFKEEIPMIVWLKNPTTGEFEKSGFFPADCRAMIATDTRKPAGDYTLEEAEKLVADMIAKKRKYYRYEIHPTTASQLKHKAKAKPAAKPKPEPKAKAAKKETGKQRRARLKGAGLCTACGKRKARKGFCECQTCADYYSKWAAKRGGK
jgi:hypothetical protein